MVSAQSLLITKIMKRCLFSRRRRDRRRGSRRRRPRRPPRGERSVGHARRGQAATEYPDRVRGEGIMPWGVAAAKRVGLCRRTSRGIELCNRCCHKPKIWMGQINRPFNIREPWTRGGGGGGGGGGSLFVDDRMRTAFVFPCDQTASLQI